MKRSDSCGFMPGSEKSEPSILFTEGMMASQPFLNAGSLVLLRARGLFQLELLTLEWQDDVRAAAMGLPGAHYGEFKVGYAAAGHGYRRRGVPAKPGPPVRNLSGHRGMGAQPRPVQAEAGTT